MSGWQGKTGKSEDTEANAATWFVELTGGPPGSVWEPRLSRRAYGGETWAMLQKEWVESLESAIAAGNLGEQRLTHTYPKDKETI